MELTDDQYGEAVRDAWVGACEEVLPNPPPQWMKSWAETSPIMKKLYTLFGKLLHKRLRQLETSNG
jgi:hypothetical protein